MITQNDNGQYIFDDSYDIAIDDCIVEFMDDLSIDDEVCLITVDIEHMTAQKVIETFIDQIGQVCGTAKKHTYTQLILDFEGPVDVDGKPILAPKDLKYHIDGDKVDIVVQLKSFMVVGDAIVPDLVLKSATIRHDLDAEDELPPHYSTLGYIPPARPVRPVRPVRPAQPEKFDSHVLAIPKGQTGLHNMIDKPFSLWSVMTISEN
jgi:hypothetical protein